MLNNVLIALLCLLLPPSLAGQVWNTNPLAHYNFNNGLASYNANTIIQDKQGFIWIGTINGLQRFDGHRFLTFRRNPDNPKTLTDNYIDHLFYDSKGNLWTVLGNGQIGIFDTRKFTYTSIKLQVSDERTLRLPRILMEDSDGTMLYIIYGHEVATYNEKLREFSAEHNFFSLPTNWKVVSLVEDAASKKYWIATDSGMCVYNKRTNELSYKGQNAENISLLDKQTKNTLYTHLKIDKRSRFWFANQTADGTMSQLNVYDLKADKLLMEKHMLDIKRNYKVKRLLQQKDGKIWIGGSNVFMKYDEPHNKFNFVFQEGAEKIIDFQEVNSIFEDRDNNIWVSTDNNGVYIFKPSAQHFTSVKHMNRKLKMEGAGGSLFLMSNDEGEIYSSVWQDGIHRFDRDLDPIPEDMHSDSEKKPYTIWSICSLKNKKTYWMGLQSGLLVYDVASGVAEHHNPAPFANKLVRSIAQDSLGNIWLALPSAGLFKWNPIKARYNFDAGFTKIANTPNSLIEEITVDSKGFVWVSTLMNGVYKINAANDSIIENITTKGPPSKRLVADAVTDVFEYNDSIIILLTGPLNIYNTRSDSIIQITTAEGLPFDIVRSIQKDDKNNLWLGFFNGLCRMNMEKRTYTYYDRNDGMANDNFNYTSSCRLPDGRLAFGTTTDFVVFNPDELNTSLIPPDVTITDFKVLNRSVSVDSLYDYPTVELGPDQNFVSVGFSALSYFNNKYSYYYTLEGLDKEWKKANELYQVDYNYLPPGSYAFKVRAENADGISSKNISIISIKVNPPIYKTWWFYSILILLVALLLYMIDKERMRKKYVIQKMRSDIADNLHREVNTALNKINILSEMARIKAEKDPVKSQEYFEQIHNKSHDMMIAMDDMLWSIDPSNDTMERTIDRLREYIDALKRRHNAKIELLVDNSAEKLSLNMKLRHDVFILMKLGIKSVIEAGTKDCRVHLGLQKDSMLYTIDINNDGVDMQQLKNILQQTELEKRLQDLNANLNSYMHQHTSIFELHVPVP